MLNILRATLRNTDYRASSGNSNNVADLLVQPALGGSSVPQTHGVGNFCFLNNDVFNVETPSPSGQVGAYYENTASGGPYVATVLAPFSYTQLLWVSILGFIVFGELPDIWTVTGAVFIVGSGLYTAHRERVRRSQLVAMDSELSPNA